MEQTDVNDSTETILKRYEERLFRVKGSLKNDGLVKSLQGRHSREGGSPEVIDFPGFPLSRE